MLDILNRLVKRLIVLIPGLLLAWFAAHNVFPGIHRLRVPTVLAVFITYVITAYGLIPAALRIIRLFVKAQHLPLYCTTPDGFASDPINIGIIGNKQDLIKTMEQAGWHQADSLNIRNLATMMVATILRRPYPTAPFSNLYLLGRKQDIGFERLINNSSRKRHHVRYWALQEPVGSDFQDHLFYWQKHHQNSRDRILWLGAVSRDIGIRPIRHTAQLTHMVHPDTDAERELLVQQLQETGYLDSIRKVQAGQAYRLDNRVVGGYLIADGRITICEIKRSKLATANHTKNTS